MELKTQITDADLQLKMFSIKQQSHHLPVCTGQIKLLVAASGTPQPPSRYICGASFKILVDVLLELSHTGVHVAVRQEASNDPISLLWLQVNKNFNDLVML